MKKKRPMFPVVLLVAALSLAASSCATGSRLTLRSADETQVTGNFRLILYGCTHFDDLETLAILDKEGDPYTFEPYAPDFSYRVKTGVQAKDALAEAERFVNCDNAFKRYQLARLVAPGGATLGFEVRPLYMPFVYGMEDVIRTDYRIKGDKVIVRIWLSESVDSALGDVDTRGRER